MYDFDFGRIHLKSIGSNHMTKIINRFQVEVTFLAICIQTIDKVENEVIGLYVTLKNQHKTNTYFPSSLQVRASLKV
jgi:hypothetical protein